MQLRFGNGWLSNDMPFTAGHINVDEYDSPYFRAQRESKMIATSWESIVDCLKCDAKGCNGVARHRCHRCEMAYYCSVGCRIGHKREHLNDLCRDVHEMREMNDTMQSRKDVSMRGWAHATQLSGKSTFNALLAQAEYIHQVDQEWEVAIALYKDLLMREQCEGTPPQ